MPFIFLTENEREILGHRLEVQDALAEALTSDGLQEWSYDDVWNATEEMRGTVASDCPLFVPEEGLRLAIAVDALEGSTFFANLADDVASGDLTRGKATALRRAGRTVAEKIGAVAGRPINIPCL